MDKETFEKIAKISENMKSLQSVIKTLIYAIILIMFAEILFNNL